MGQDSLQGWPLIHRSPRGRHDERDPEKYAFDRGRLRRGILKYLYDTGTVRLPYPKFQGTLTRLVHQSNCRREGDGIFGTQTLLHL